MEKILYKLNRYFRGDWQIGIFEEKKGVWAVSPLVEACAYFKAMNAKGLHILMQPKSASEPYFLIADDISEHLLHLHHMHSDGVYKAGRMVVETSKANYQVWIRSHRPMNIPEKCHFLKLFKSDPAAHPKHRWGRCPGFRNRKKKYKDHKGRYPLAKLIWIDWRNDANVPDTSIDTIKVSQCPTQSLPHPPSGDVCHQSAIKRCQYEKDDESATDFAYALALARSGHDAGFIQTQIMNQRKDWTHHHGQKRVAAYLNRTVTKAINIVATT